MFRLVWVIGFILGGAPQIQKMPDPADPMSFEDCQATAFLNKDRMADWARGFMRQPLGFPIGVYGECEPVLRDAAKGN